MIALSFRAFIYLCLALLIAQLALYEVSSQGAEGAFSEFGLVQLSQSALLASGVLLAFLARSFARGPAVLAGAMSLCFAMLLLRENDQLLELFLPHGFWKWPVLALFAWLVLMVVRGRDTLAVQLRSFSQTLACGVFLSAFATLVFSRLFGSSGFWEVLMQDAYWRPVKNAVEEGTELLAIALLTAGAFEFFLQERRRRDAV